MLTFCLLSLFLLLLFFLLEFRRPLLNHHFLFRAIQLETIAKTRRAIAPLLGNGLRNRCRPRYTPAYDDYNGDYSVTGFSFQPAEKIPDMRIRFVRSSIRCWWSTNSLAISRIKIRLWGCTEEDKKREMEDGKEMNKGTVVIS